MEAALGSISRHRLFWPFLTLALLLAANAIFNPGFWQLQWRDGHLYGNVIDILNRAAPLALVALGMTLVIATRASTSRSAPWSRSRQPSRR
jgi:simple sugar transport system permease protein